MNSRTGKIILTLLFLGAATNIAHAQGCSDAGFCSAGALQSAAPATHDTKLQCSIAFSFTAGAGEQGTAILIPQLEWQQPAGRNGLVELKLPYYFASGTPGSHSGIGDPMLTYTRTVIKTAKLQMKASGGLRISTGTADARNADGLSLPMPYQANLGTTDIILGLSARCAKYIVIAAGYQQPVIQYNENGYLPADIYMSQSSYAGYFASAKLKRKGDVLLRAEGQYSLRHWHVSAGPLFIYHLGKDHITNMQDMDMALDGSEGLTLNIAGNIAWTSGRWKVDLSGGTPFIVRSYRPDGLTREWVITPRFSYFFK